MKQLVFTIALLLTTVFALGQNKTTTITVTVHNVTSSKGKVLFGLHTKDTFMTSKGIQGAASSIVDGKATAEFKNVEPGTYAILVLHDENDNKRMDFQSNGMPAENYAMSNNPMSYGPPQFNDAKFEVTDKDLNLDIRF